MGYLLGDGTSSQKVTRLTHEGSNKIGLRAIATIGSANRLAVRNRRTPSIGIVRPIGNEANCHYQRFSMANDVITNAENYAMGTSRKSAARLPQPLRPRLCERRRAARFRNVNTIDRCRLKRSKVAQTRCACIYAPIGFHIRTTTSYSGSCVYDKRARHRAATRSDARRHSTLRAPAATLLFVSATHGSRKCDDARCREHRASLAVDEKRRYPRTPASTP